MICYKGGFVLYLFKRLKIIKNCYIIRGRGENNIFEGSSDITGGKLIPPRNFIIGKNTKTGREELSDENDKKLFAGLLDV